MTVCTSHASNCVVGSKDTDECDVCRMVEALSAAHSVMWMAERYAEGGGTHGPEMWDYTEAMSKMEEFAP